MYSFGIILTLCILAGGVNSQDYEPSFVVAPEEYMVEGDPLTMKCEVNAGPEFMAERLLRFRHRSGKTGEEVTISNQATLVEEMQQKGYSLQYNMAPKFSVEISLSAATPDVDGEFLCQVVTQSGNTVLEEVSTPVQFLGGVERVELVVGNTTVSSPDQRLDFRLGQVPVKCSSYGSNPAPMIHLSIGDTDIPADLNVIKDQESDYARRSFTGGVMTMLDFNRDMIGKKLSCHAETSLPDGLNFQLPDASSSAVLHAIVDEPTVECSNNTGSMNDKQVTLKCKVSKVPPLQKVFFSVGSKYEIYPGDKTDDLTICKVNEFDMDFNEYVLQFYELEEWHFTANVYLEAIGLDDTVYKYPLYLIKGDDGDDVSGSAAVASSLLVLVSSVVVALSVLKSS